MPSPGMRPEYVTCIQHTHAERKGTTWCGRPLGPLGEFCFVDIDHAAYERLRGGRLLVCPECARIVTERLNSDD
jgi:hypothetical protein